MVVLYLGTVRNMAKRTKDLTQQIAVRMEPELVSALEADARRNGRTLAQSVRHYVRQALQPNLAG